MRTSIFRLPAKRPADAADWIARLGSPNATEADRAAFDAWLASDPRHRQAYELSASLQRMALGAGAQHDMVNELLVDAEGESEAVARSPAGHHSFAARPWVRYALAATVAIFVAGLGLHFASVSEDPKVVTRRGEQRVIHLADGSTIQLNTDTLLTYNMDSSVRRVSLTKGEAFFDVARDPSKRPFVVKAGRSEVHVLGTQFSVRQVGERFEVVVKEGRVEVIPEPNLLSAESSKRVELTPGNRMELERQTIKVAAVDVNRSMAWRHGEIDFRGELLEDVIAELNRYTETPMVIEDDELRGLRVTGIFKVTQMASIRFMLRESLGVEFAQRGSELVLSAAKR